MGGSGKCYGNKLIKSDINWKSSVDNKSVNICTNDNVKTVNSSQLNIQFDSKISDNNPVLKVNSEGTSQSGCRADVLCPIGDCKCLCMVRNSSMGAASGSIANCKNDTNNTNSTSNDITDQNSTVGPRAIPVTYHHNAIVTPQSYSDTSVERYRIDFTNWHFVQHDTGYAICIVHIRNLEIKGHDSKFYNFHTVGCGVYPSVTGYLRGYSLSITLLGMSYNLTATLQS